ncbi:PLP-dependent transferase [Haloechinothrix sp. LS1_15]|uniref:trans-sulfuration enzyme family protein n=1 Tax=Haloechinothrix sp. LS1_15 TaxID=2652248 RepID=UPI002947E376|nr:PLP-dependent transferase [Haloechinothrix sp. LS1_15]MDV6013744.1 PLP-dependent transferase [Haloechinothrix sp. LS1_15]
MLHDHDFATAAVHAGERRPGPDGSVVFPIYQGTVFSSVDGERYDEIQYHRLNSTPSQLYLHDKLAELEGGQAAIATSSGMTAVTTALLSVMRAGDHLIAGDVLYGGTAGFLDHFAERLGWSYTLVDPTRPDTWEAARTASTRAFLVESITNPLVRVGKLADVADFAAEHGLVSIIDNTFASPVNFQPLATGFDLSVHSATKYLGGHSDLVAGCVIGGDELISGVRGTLNYFGGCLDPHAGFLLARGLKTLAVRVRAQNENAMALARFFESHPEVAEVHYPGLPSHPDHTEAAALMTGFGGMLSLRPAGGVDAARRFVSSVSLPYSAPSLGGVETLITRPAVTSHASLPPEQREAIGVTDDLVRISCGIESSDDLLADVKQALEVT